MNARRISIALIVVCGLLLVAELFFDKHSHFSWSQVIGFDALFGFAAYLSIVFAAKALRKIVKRREDYYDE